MKQQEKRRLWHLMVDKDIHSLSELARQAGVSRSSLTMLYYGGRNNHNLRQKIADFFGVEYSAIFDPPQPPPPKGD